ncbi:SRA stem-loop-interacting RNA-binding protein, mitochondrial isoform X2 [Hemicordylus capensis]|uniref:SRA stem-loop-interacting RNA-binding protein, mitochondrial isoform X2 n=1 Tax=Hemicordylus capensis TaxID=884348 RepID=UPI00230337E4|nr:SRA stem-loop-interacting RNA-binding protein, mitochondrial isoform X2 [Hemicordylus capensis]
MAAVGPSRRVFEVFVARIPWTVSANEIRKYFAQFGSVKRCTLPFNKETGFHKSFCWVGFSTEEGFKNALQKNTHILEGVKLDVQHQKKSVFPGQYSGRRIADTN